jgi:hypothetical protein
VVGWSWRLALLGVASCAAPGSLDSVSSVDVRYRLQRLEQAAPLHPESPSVAVYQRALRGTVGATCSLAPSDSAAAQWRFSRCGHFAAVQAMARFMMEPDAAKVLGEVTVLDGAVRFVDLPACEGR